MYSCGPLHMDVQRQDDQLETTYSSSVPIRDVAQKTYQKQWMIGRGGERGSGISVLMGKHAGKETFLRLFYAKFGFCFCILIIFFSNSLYNSFFFDTYNFVSLQLKPHCYFFCQKLSLVYRG